MYKVLLVDDEPAMIDQQKRAISGRAPGYEVVGEAYGVKQAIESVDRLAPDVVITDIKMPGDSGIELLKHIYNLDEPIITVVVSGYDDFDYVHDAFMYNAFDYMLKPIEPRKLGELFAKITETLERKEKLAETERCEERVVTTDTLLIEEIERYLREHLSEDNSIVVICKRFSISQPYLSRLFKKNEGCTYNDYLIRMKISEAKRLLTYRQDFLIGQIAELTGFSDQFYFSKVFKNLCGLTPSEFRKAEGSREVSGEMAGSVS